MRSLENQIKKIMRKAAMDFADAAATEPIVIGRSEVESFLGKPVFTAEEVFEETPGVVTGLAWTSLGGATLQIEATAMPSKTKGFKQTGQLGNVMVESSEIAYSYVMAHLQGLRRPGGLLRQPLRPPARAGRRHPQGRPLGRHHHGHRAALDDHSASRCATSSA